jgi:tetratricopeptide (TPR) repeat protein
VEKVNDNLIWTEDGFGNSAEINLGTKVFVIDSMINCNLAETWRKLIEEYFDQPISGLILTHAHDDHVLGNQIFKEVPIIACSHIREIMSQKLKEEWLPDKLKEFGIKGLQIVLPTFVFDSEEAIIKYQQANAIRPHHANTLMNWGVALKRLGHLEEAIEKYQQASKIQPENAAIYDNWGNALKQGQHFQEAKKVYEKAARELLKAGDTFNAKKFEQRASDLIKLKF